MLQTSVREKFAIEAADSEEGWMEEQVCSTEAVGQVLETVVQSMKEAGFPQKDIFAMRLALEEAILNALTHGHRNDRTKWVRIRYAIQPDSALAEVEDQGPGFDPRQVPDPTAPEILGSREAVAYC